MALTLRGLAVAAAPLRDWLVLAPLWPVDWVIVAVAGVLPAIAGQVLKASHRPRAM